jgi:uncharacterized protein (TIGR03086 family)
LSTTDPVDLLTRALDRTAETLAGVRDDQLGLPTPCRSWPVRTLVDHLVNDVRQFTIRATGGKPDFSTNPPVEGDREAAFRAGADELVAAWREAGDLSGTIEVPGMGEMPARMPIDQALTELSAHTWDLAKATGQPVKVDEEAAETGLAFAQANLRPEFRGSEDEGKSFGPEVDAEPDAPVADRLAAWFGRDPAWKPAS